MPFSIFPRFLKVAHGVRIGINCGLRIPARVALIPGLWLEQNIPVLALTVGWAVISIYGYIALPYFTFAWLGVSLLQNINTTAAYILRWQYR
jgi:hypothetical protein